MAVLERERIDITRPERVGRRSYGWIVVLAAFAVAAVAVAIGFVLSGARTTQPEAAATLLTPDEQALVRLANQGYIPAAAVNWELIDTKLLVNEGIVPAQTLEPYTPALASLWTPQERALMDAVARGLVPEQALDHEAITTKQLINQGLIPNG